MASYQSHTIIGNIGQDAEVKYSQNGNLIVSFSVATKSRRTKETVWNRVSVFNKLAETMANLIQNNGALSKGSQVHVEGELNVSTYQKNDGTTGVSLDITADKITLLGSASDEQSQGYQPQAPQQGYQQAPQQQFAPPPLPQQPQQGYQQPGYGAPQYQNQGYGQ